MNSSQRIISLCPSITETLFALGCGDRIVGITRYCIHPETEVAKIEKVGGTKDPDLDRIRQLNPSLVLMDEEENRYEDAQALKAAGLHCQGSLQTTVEETASNVRTLGLSVHRVEPAEAIAREIEMRAQHARRAAEGTSLVTFAYLIWRNPWMTVNAETYVHSLLALSRGRNVFARRPQRYPQITAEDLAVAAPQVILLGTEPFPFRPQHIEELATATGLPVDRFQIVDGEYLSWHGARTPEGIEYAGRITDGVRHRLK